MGYLKYPLTFQYTANYKARRASSRKRFETTIEVV